MASPVSPVREFLDLIDERTPILLGPGTADGHFPPVVDRGAASSMEEQLRGWCRSHRIALRALAQAVAAVPSRCVISLAIEADTRAWFRETAPTWHELAAEPGQGQLLISLCDHSNSSFGDLGQLIFDLRRLHDPRWVAARSHCYDAPLLAVGVDVENAEMRRLLRNLRRRTPGLTGLVVTAGTPSLTARAELDDLGFVAVTADPIACLRDVVLYARQQSGVGVADDLTPRRLRRPYRLLESYTSDEGDLFFGRQALSERLFRLVAAYRLVVVTGASGNGKTSLINAGLLPRMRRRANVVAVSVRCDVDAVRAIVAAIDGQLGTKRPTFTGSLTEYLEALRRQVFPIIVLDQAEEIYTRLGERPREALLAALRRCLCHSPQLATFVISLREDYLSVLSDLRTSVPTLLQTTLYVSPLSPPEARDAILEPARVVGVGFSSELAETIIGELVSGNRGTIAPPQLQIVCSRLYEEWQQRGRPAQGIDQELYEALGECRGTLADFVDRSLAQLGTPSEQAIGWEVLKSMVTSEGTKDLLPVAEIAARAKLETEVVCRLLHAFRDGPRLIRELSDDHGTRYELAHEYLVASIWRRMSDLDRRRRRVEEDLAREVRAWEHFSDVRLGVDRLQRYAEFPDLVARSESALALVLLSTIKNLQPRDAWTLVVTALPIAGQDTLARILLNYVGAQDVVRRREAAEVLARLDPGLLVRALIASDPAVRHAALRIAASVGLADAIPSLVSAVIDAMVPLDVQQDAMAGLVRLWGQQDAPPRRMRDSEQALLAGLLAASGEQRLFAFGALLDLGRHEGLRLVLKAFSSVSARPLVLGLLDKERAARFCRFLRYRRNRSSLHIWHALAVIPEAHAACGEVLRELMGFSIMGGGRQFSPSVLPRPPGWPLSRVEIEAVLATDVPAGWLRTNLEWLLALRMNDAESDADWSAERVRAQVQTLPGRLRIIRQPWLLVHALGVLDSRADVQARLRLIELLDRHSSQVAQFDESAWTALTSDPDPNNRERAFAIAIRQGPVKLARKGLQDRHWSVRYAALNELIRQPRIADAPAWLTAIESARLKYAPANKDQYFIAAAVHGGANSALRDIDVVDSGTLGNLMAHAQVFVPQLDVGALAIVVNATLAERYQPFLLRATTVIHELAGQWERIDANERERLLTFTLHHASADIRAAAVAFARIPEHRDVLKFLLSDGSDQVKVSAWNHILRAEPGSAAIDVDMLERVIADERAGVGLRATACRVAQRHAVVGAVNVLKAVADSDLSTGSRERAQETLGQVACEALLAVWPESAAWIRRVPRP